MAPLNALVEKDLVNNGDLEFTNEIPSSGFTIACVVSLASICGLIILIVVCACCGGGRRSSKEQKIAEPETVLEGAVAEKTVAEGSLFGKSVAAKSVAAKSVAAKSVAEGSLFGEKWVYTPRWPDWKPNPPSNVKTVSPDINPPRDYSCTLLGDSLMKSDIWYGPKPKIIDGKLIEECYPGGTKSRWMAMQGSIKVDPGVMPTILKAAPGVAGAPASVAEDHVYFEVDNKGGVSKKLASKGGYRSVCPLGADSKVGTERRKAAEQSTKATTTLCREVGQPAPVAKKGGYRSMAPMMPIEPKAASTAPYGYREGKTQVREN